MAESESKQSEIARPTPRLPLLLASLGLVVGWALFLLWMAHR